MAAAAAPPADQRRASTCRPGRTRRRPDILRTATQEGTGERTAQRAREPQQHQPAQPSLQRRGRRLVQPAGCHRLPHAERRGRRWCGAGRRSRGSARRRGRSRGPAPAAQRRPRPAPRCPGRRWRPRHPGRPGPPASARSGSMWRPEPSTTSISVAASTTDSLKPSRSCAGAAASTWPSAGLLRARKAWACAPGTGPTRTASSTAASSRCQPPRARRATTAAESRTCGVTGTATRRTPVGARPVTCRPITAPGRGAAAAPRPRW